MIALSIALTLIAIVVTLGVRDMRAQESRERVVLRELQGTYDAEKRELTEALAESNRVRVAIEELAARDRSAMKAQHDALAVRVAEVEARLRHVTAPGRGR